MARCACAPALTALREAVDALAPTRDRSSDGCCGDAAHALRKSDHNPLGGWAHALDIDEDLRLPLPPGVLAERPLEWLWRAWIKAPDRRLKYLIYERRIWYASTGDMEVYEGLNAHEHHLHVSITLDATFHVEPWNVADLYQAAFPMEELMAADLFIPHPAPMAINGRVRGYTLDVANQNLIGWNGAQIADSHAVDFIPGFLNVLSLTDAYHPQHPGTHLGISDGGLVVFCVGDGGTLGPFPMLA